MAEEDTQNEITEETKDKSRMWVTNASDEIAIRFLSDEGAAAETPITVIQAFKNAVEKFGDKVALTSADFKTNLTWRQYYEECRRFAKSLIQLEVQPYESVNMIGYNSIEYVVANMGGILAQTIAAGVYTTNNAEACHYVSEHSDAAVVVCQGLKQLEKYLAIQDRLPKLKALVMYNIAYSDKDGPVQLDELPERPEGSVPLYTWEQFQALGAEVPDAQLDERMDAQKPGNCCTLIYTSGTTGPPKAVMISHDNITWTAQRVKTKLGLTSNDRFVSYLPLNHIAAQMLDIHSPMAFGFHVTFADPNALRGSLVPTLRKVHPTVFFGVPRVWEKMQEGMQGKAATGGLKKKISTWAKNKGLQNAELQQFGAGGGTPWCFGCANSLAFSKIKDALGLDQCRICSTGAAPITMDTLRYLGSLNLHILELFGQSECTGPATFNAPGEWKMGTCGRAIEGTELIIVEDTKEIIYRGRHIFMGYMKMPEKTAETIDENGFLHSGDQGHLDEDGFMRITGRIKELIITAGGENIPPVLIEEGLLKVMPAVSSACVIGDKRKFLTVLLTIKSEVDPTTGEPQQALAPAALKVAQQIGSEAKTVAEAAECEKFTEYFNNGLKTANESVTSRAHKVQKFALLPVDFSVPGGELTATLKLKRDVVHEKYADTIEEFYA
jgi:long-chain-fatty-acid--CoA ligase ACSBG